MLFRTMSKYSIVSLLIHRESSDGYSRFFAATSETLCSPTISFDIAGIVEDKPFNHVITL
jgi:hypothetical protein